MNDNQHLRTESSPNGNQQWRAVAASTLQDFAPSRLVPTLAIGLVSGVILVTLTISLAALIFRGDLAHGLPLGIGLTLFATFVIGVVSVFGSGLAGTVAGVQDNTAAVIGAAAGYLFLWSIYWAFKLLTGKEGMGYGDFKLLAALGAWLGWQFLPQIILVSAVTGAVIGIGMIAIRGRDRNIPIPFGPYLAAAGWLSLIWGEQINQAYFRLAGIH